jgi:hypothetical protein
MYHGVTYEFASKKDEAAFEANPEKYVPQWRLLCFCHCTRTSPSSRGAHERTKLRASRSINKLESRLHVLARRAGGGEDTVRRPGHSRWRRLLALRPPISERAAV